MSGTFLETVKALATGALPSELLFYPAIAQDIVATYVQTLLTAAGSPWSLLPVVRCGTYDDTAEDRVVVSCQQATPELGARVLARSLPVTVTLYSTRDIPLLTMAAYMSGLMVGLQRHHLLEQLPGVITAAGYPVTITSVEDEGEGQEISSEAGRTMFKRFRLGMTRADIPAD